MSITYAFDPRTGILHTRCAGEVSLEETLEHFDEIGTDPTVPSACQALLDLRDLVRIPETSQLRGAVEGVDRRLENRVEWGPWAIVAERDVVYGMSRMFQVFLEQVGIRSEVFRSYDEALEWLGREESPPR